MGIVGSLLLSYAIAFVVAAFMYKRSLMLGASGRTVYFPGAIPGSQGYTREAEILDSVSIKLREWPFDIALSFISFVIGSLTLRTELEFYQSLMRRAAGHQILVQVVIQGAIFVTLNVLVLHRGKITGT
jgi:hypothetical protein